MLLLDRDDVHVVGQSYLSVSTPFTLLFTIDAFITPVLSSTTSRTAGLGPSRVSDTASPLLFVGRRTGTDFLLAKS